MPLRRIVIGFALLTAVGLVASVVTNAPQGDDPTARATRIAMLISDIMNTVAFTVLVVLLPLIVAVVLQLRARRAGARGAA